MRGTSGRRKAKRSEKTFFRRNESAFCRISKAARAEAIAALFESGRAKLAGHFPELEDQLCGMLVGGAYIGPGRSPDRADAMVWALTELMLRNQRAEPRIRML